MKTLCLILFFLFFQNYSVAQDILLLSDTTKEIEINRNHFSIFEDPEANLDFESIKPLKSTRLIP
jgi:hypothetical protein